MGVLLIGAMVLEAAGQSREDRGEVIVISGGSSLGTDEAAAEDEPLLGNVLDDNHAQARRLVQRGQYREAETLFDTLLGTYGRTAELLSEVGYLELISGRTVQSQKTLEEARVLAPGNAWLALTLATASKRNHKPADAEAMYLEALRLRPHYSAAKLALGRFYRQERKLAQATPLLEEISTSGSNDDRAEALAELGRVYLELGRDSDAERSFELAIGRAPASVAIRSAIAQAYLASGGESHLARATEVLQRAIQLAPAAAQLQSLLGVALVERGDTGAGRAALEKSLELDPAYSYSRRRLLRLDLKAGAYTEARANAALLLNEDPNSSEFQFLAGLVEGRDGNLEAAKSAYERAIALADGEYPEAFMNLGSLERRAHHYDKAIELYGKALELRPGYREASNNMGLALLAAGRDTEALEAMTALVAQEPGYEEAWLNLAKVYSSSKKYEEATAALYKALEIRPDYAAAELNLASVLRKSGKAAAAVEVYDKILASQPRYVSAWYNRGIALEEADNAPKARASYEQAIRLDEGHILSLKRLARLELRSGNTARAEALYTEILDRDAVDAKSRRLRGEARAAQGDGTGCLRDANVAQKQDPKNSNLERLFTICNATGS